MSYKFIRGSQISFHFIKMFAQSFKRMMWIGLIFMAIGITIDLKNLVKNDEDINRSFDENVIKKIGKKYTNTSEEIDKIKKLIYNKEEDE